MSSKNKQTGILAFVPDLWGDIWQSRHHVFSGLSDHYKVLWVSPPTYWQGWLKSLARETLSGRGLHKISNRFWGYAVRLPADYKPQYSKHGFVADGFRLYHKIWMRLYIARIKKLLRHMEIEEVILYVWRPEFHWSLGSFDEKLTCYHIDDDYGFNPDEDSPISDEEMKLLIQSDLVFIHSRTLMEKKGHINPNTYYMPNGVDFEHYREVMHNDLLPPDDIAAIPGPRIGYVGYIKRHIDLPLLLSLARSRRNWSIVLIGPVRSSHTDITEEVAQLRQEPNIYFLGGKPQTAIPHYIKALDVCLMPYRQTNYTKYIYPMKLHEYLACGKPVVATSLENLQEFSNVIRFASAPEEWIDAIHQALDSKPEAHRKRKIETARANSWQARIDNIKAHIEKFSTY